MALRRNAPRARGHRRAPIAFGAVIALAVAAGPAAANTLTVTTTQDEMNATDGTCSLREAIVVADNPATPTDCSPASQSQPNTIVLGPQRYTLTIQHNTPYYDGQSARLMIFTIPTTIIQGAGPSTVIDASGLNDQAVMVVTGAAASFRDLTITAGHAVTEAGFGLTGGTGDDGGGIRNDGTLTVDHVIVSGNYAGAGGAGGTGANATTLNAKGGSGGDGGSGGRGGGIFNDGTLTVIDSTITGNHAGTGGTGGVGGAAVDPAYQGGDGGNGGAAGDGGGIASVGAAASLTVTRSTITGNFAGDGGGGGSPGGPAPGHLGADYFAGNSGNGHTGGWGGGISDLSGAATVINSTVTADVTGIGGAPGQQLIGTCGPGCQIHEGQDGSYGADGNGGGLRITAPSSATLTNDTVAGNAAAATMFERAGLGGGIYEQSPVTLENTLLASNGGGGNCETNTGTVLTQFVDGGHNLSFGDLSCPASFASGDPKLGTLKDNGGPTLTMALAPGSTARDDGADCPPTDQRGVARPSGASCDIGAYELAPPKISAGPITHVTSAGATVTDSLIANQSQASAFFQIGPKTSYGSQTSVQHVLGLSATSLSATFTGLRPDTTYHYRMIASSSDGTTTGAGQTFTTRPVTPVISKLRVSKRISYIDTEPASTTLILLRCRNRSCSRQKRIDTISHPDQAGPNIVGLPRLKAGRYRLKAIPRIGALVGRALTVGFRIR
jgi:CSLREA domain-containing protein